MTGVAGLGGIVELGAALTSRGLTPGKTGNLSVRGEGLISITPTGAVLGSMRVEDISTVTADEGEHVSGRRASKELAMHQAMYQVHQDCFAIVHVHSLHAVAVSCLSGIDDREPLPRITPYFDMKVPTLRLVDYHPPGSDDLAAAVRSAAPGYRSLLLRNHGSLVAAPTLEEAADAAEEIEQTAALMLLLHGRAVNRLSATTSANASGGIR